MISRNSLADEDVTGAKPPPSYGTIRTERLAVVMKQNPSSTEVVSSGEAQDLHSANEWKETSRANVPLLRPAPKKSPGLGKGIKAILFASPLNILLVCIPISWILRFAMPNKHLLNFVLSCLVMIPLKNLISIAIHELSAGFGIGVAHLMDATSGNAAEFIVGILTITHCELLVTQSLLVGSILANLLLVVGLGYFVGGIANQDLRVTRTTERTSEQLTFISGVYMFLTVMFVGSFYAAKNRVDPMADDAARSTILNASRTGAIVFLLWYISIVFASNSFTGREDGNFDSPSTLQATAEGETIVRHRVSDSGHISLDLDSNGEGKGDVATGYGGGDCAGEVPTSIAMCTVLLAIIALVVTAEFLLKNIRGVTDEPLSLKKEWVSLVLLPMAIKVPEFLKVATSNDKRVRCCEVVVGSSLQIAMFITPLLVVIAWILGKPLLMFSDALHSVILLNAVVLVHSTMYKPYKFQGEDYFLAYGGIAVLSWLFYEINALQNS